MSVDPFHLFRYLDEQCFRFNKRRLTDAERFVIVMAQTIGRRITYDELTGSVDFIVKHESAALYATGQGKRTKVDNCERGLCQKK